MPAIPATRKYVEVRLKQPDIHMAETVVAALISVIACQLDAMQTTVEIPTSFAGSKLTDLSTFSTVSLREQWRESRYGDVVCIEVQLGVFIPNVGFRVKHADDEQFRDHYAA